jgi:uncharacterized protein DUF3352
LVTPVRHSGTQSSSVRRALVIAALVLTASGCGGTSTGGAGGAGDALGYLAANSATVILISTDVEGEQWQQFYRRVGREFVGDEGGERTLDENANELFRSSGVDWEEDVKPLLGNDVAIGIEGDPVGLLGGDGESSFLAALETRGGDIEAVLEKAGWERAGQANGATLYTENEGDDLFAVEDGVFLTSDDEATLRRALARRDAGEGLDESAVSEAFADLPEQPLARAFGTAAPLAEQEQLARFADLPLMQALETWALTVEFEDDDLNVDVAVRLDEAKLDEADLPLVTGEEAPEIVLREGELSGGNRNQSQTTAFLLRALRAGYPDSRFVRAADAIEDELGIDFEQEILRQFDGPSASYVSPDGQTFAARSEVRDPEALRAVLPRIAPHLPALVEGLQGLESEGMALLFLFAPDAPAAAPMSEVKVDPPSTPDGFYRISGLTGEGPSELYLGLVGDLFVVASDEQRAREIAEADTVVAEGAQGAGVLRADLRRLQEAAAALPFPIDGKELVASLEASTSELRARVRVRLD